MESKLRDSTATLYPSFNSRDAKAAPFPGPAPKIAATLDVDIFMVEVEFSQRILQKVIFMRWSPLKLKDSF